MARPGRGTTAPKALCAPASRIPRSLVYLGGGFRTAVTFLGCLLWVPGAQVKTAGSPALTLLSPFPSVPRTFGTPSIKRSSLDWRWTLSWKCLVAHKIWGWSRAYSSAPLLLQTGSAGRVWSLPCGARGSGCGCVCDLEPREPSSFVLVTALPVLRLGCAVSLRARLWSGAFSTAQNRGSLYFGGRGQSMVLRRSLSTPWNCAQKLCVFLGHSPQLAPNSQNPMTPFSPQPQMLEAIK